MTAPIRQRPAVSHLRWLPALTLAGIVLFFGVTGARILHAAGQQEDNPADAIVVFGAAQYDGRPSPVYKARLDHAFDLFQLHLASVIITTGGAGGDPTYSEGGVGHTYLMRRGVPDASLIAETMGSDTAQSAERVGVILRANRMRSCIAVSDAYHVFRIKKLLEHEGVRVFVAPRPDSRPHLWRQRVVAVLREALAYGLWTLNIPE